MKIFICFIVLFGVFSCKAENVKSHMRLSANFDNSKIDQVDSIFEDVAAQYQLRVFKKDRKQMKYLSQDRDAFFTVLYFKEGPVFTLTNIGVTDKLVFTVADFKNMSIAELERIAYEVKNRIETGINIKFQPDQ
jgi:hypothetical protein